MRELDKARAMLSLHEGRVAHAYKDSLGYLTIGVGHLIDEAKGGRLPEHIIDALLDHDIREHWGRLAALCPWIDRLDEVRQYVLLDMTFNLGSLGGWPIFRQQVESGRYDAAADNMMATKWARQVKSRATRLSKMMRTGEWPSDV